jgi:hypothetical protein
MYPEALDSDDCVALPTDGVEVEEIRDADTVRLFVREWQWRARMHFGDRRTAQRKTSVDGGMIDA